jgi:hypothetical protein
MLPGFRFLFAAIVLSVSIAVFGFGAAALFRSAHEEFANAPAWRPAPETRFAQAEPPAQPATPPVLAMLRVDDSAKEAEPSVVAPAPANQAATAPTEPEQTVALQQTDSAPTTATKPDVQIATAPAAETEVPASPVPANVLPASPVPTPPAQDEAAPAAAVPDETKIAAVEPTPAPLSDDPSAWPPETFDAPPETSAISTRIATLGGPPVFIEQPGARTAHARAEALAEAKADSALAKRQRARRAAARRHRIAAARARLAQQASQMEQPTPFGPPAALLQPR